MGKVLVDEDVDKLVKLVEESPLDDLLKLTPEVEEALPDHKRPYSHYVADTRNTDDSWCQSTVVKIHLKEPEAEGQEPWSVVVPPGGEKFAARPKVKSSHYEAKWVIFTETGA
eukprot:CAMPEP_0174727830 /NCGR_PEP_ID=MMETSP1094-20130205/50573_1 /TAXON_ID=156173 /ORGANISM="Chrysochromulina brevifilum, Strain UTEX LB 985" /LENGTH=112 /DNA_ID=CAMNT_0015929657 /DNA_START=56 /DNA_END=391 /DNA_ORIENTATION=-